LMLRCGLPGLLALAVAGGPSARAATLRWKFKPGETLHYVMDQKTLTTYDTKDRQLKVTQNQTIDMRWTVKSVGADGVAEMAQTIDRIRTKIDAPPTPFEFDSKDPKEPQSAAGAAMVPILKALVGAEFSFKMNPQGELSDVKVPPQLLQTIRSLAPPGAPATAMGSEEGLKNMITESSLALPRGDNAEGTTWTRQTEVPTPPLGKMKVEKTYTFLGPDPTAGPDVHRIGLVSKLELQPTPGADISVKIKSQDTKGTFLFNNAEGRITNSEVSEKIATEVSAMGNQFTQNVETSTSMKLVKVDQGGPAR
jgi:hypothetical protein